MARPANTGKTQAAIAELRTEPPLFFISFISVAVNPASVSSASFDLHGVYRNADYSPDSFSFNAADTTLTIKYSSLPEDNYTETLFAPGFLDRVGYILDGTYEVKIDDGPVRQLKAGEVFYEYPNALHAISRNPSFCPA